MKNKLFNNPIIERLHPSGMPGFQKVYRFPNNYGASVVRFKVLFGDRYGSYTDNEDEFELAVVKFLTKENDNFTITYETPITSDVLAHLTKEGVEKILQAIKNL